MPATPRTNWQPLYQCQHGLHGFDEAYHLERQGEQLSWQLMGEWKPSQEQPMDDSAALSAGHPTLTLIQPQLNHPDGLSQRLQQRISTALDEPIMQADHDGNA